MKLKDKHRLSQTALEDVMETSSVCEHVLQEVHIAIQEAANKHNVNPQSSFLQDVMDCIETATNPLQELGTAYRQQAYVAEYFPYVVSRQKVKTRNKDRHGYILCAFLFL